MAGGSAALVALAKGEIHEVSEENSGYADLASVKQLKSEQRKALREGKLPIDKAQAMVLKSIQSDPNMASPETVLDTNASGTAAGAGGAAGTAAEASAGASGTPTGGEAEGSPAAAHSAPPTASAPQAAEPPTKPVTDVPKTPSPEPTSAPHATE